MDQNFKKMDQNVFKMSEKMQLYQVFGVMLEHVELLVLHSYKCRFKMLHTDLKGILKEIWRLGSLGFQPSRNPF